jgi:methylenetetrahydrofolate dehydrogenase (NADP+)/methenyltetrahydrofolate cyclohydrolase
MAAELIDGTAIAAAVRADVAAAVAELAEPPGLATVLVGDDPASAVYVRSKRRLCAAAGIRDLHQHVPASTRQAELAALLAGLAADPQVTGILLQLPLPSHLDPRPLLDLIPPEKDVDGLTTASAGLLAQGRPGLRPCTPAGVLALLDSTGLDLSGAQAVVVGRSDLVGKPMAQLLLQRSATVTICHSRTRDLASVCRRADVLVVAAGVPAMIGAEAVRPGATVIDVGIHRTETGLRGDVRFEEARGVAGAITPVPGGVGPMTIAMLLRNTVLAARATAGLAPAPAA